MNSRHDSIVSAIRLVCETENGMVLPVVIMLMGVLALLGTTAFLTTTTEVKITSNYKNSEQAFYAAQAGVEEARARLRNNTSNSIKDSLPTQKEWRAYIGSPATTKEKGYDSSSDIHDKYDSLQTDLDYAVQIEHQTDAGESILYWGDADGDGVNERNTTAGENIYLVTSYGSARGSNKTVEAEVTRTPTIAVPSALYVEATTTVQGNGTYVIGTDACGGADKPGLVTTMDSESVIITGSPHITGAGGDEPNIVYYGTDMDIETIVGTFKDSADFAYAVDSATHTETTIPGPGDGWGNPAPGATLLDASSCSVSNIVSYDTVGTYVKLSGGISGCGILLIEGDLDIDGDFSWYGIVVVTGSVLLTGVGERNITGALIVGETAVLGLTGGSTNLVYCSSAITSQAPDFPLRLLSWKEDM